MSSPGCWCSVAPAREGAAAHQLAGQRMAHDAFRQARAFDERLEVDAGVDAHLFAQEDEVLRADVARSARMAGKGAAAQAAAGAVESVHPELQADQRIRHR